MSLRALRPPRFGRLPRIILPRMTVELLLLLLLLLSGTVHGQQASQETAPRPLTIDDYSLWRSIGEEQISGDGHWVSYVLRFRNTLPEDANPVLNLLNLETEEGVEIPGATGGAFSRDSRWIAYQVEAGAGGSAEDAPEGEEGGDDEAGGDDPARVELRELATGQVRSWKDIRSFEFSAGSTHLVLQRRPSRGGGEGGGGRSSGSNEDAPEGVDVVVHELATGRDLLLGSVGEVAFNKEGDLLAFTIDAAGMDANGLSVLELETGRVHVLDNDAMRYDRLTWSEDGSALAVLKGEEVEGMRERENLLVAFPDLREALESGEAARPAVLDPKTAEGFPEGWVVSHRAALEWSPDGSRVFFGSKEQVETEEQDRDEDEIADVDVWNTVDEQVQSLQMRRSEADRNRTYTQAFDVTSGRFIPLADETMRDLDLAPEGPWAVGRDIRGYVHDYNPAAADLYRVDTRTGERTLMLSNQRTGSGLLGFSADGTHYLFWKELEIQAYDLDEGVSRTLGGGTAPSFVNVEDDHAAPKPSYGLEGYTSDGKAAVARTRYDLWVLPLDGSDARNLTNGEGAASEIRFRYLELDPEDDSQSRRRSGPEETTLDLAQPLTLSAYGQWTKKAGFFRLAGDELTEIVFEDASFGTPTKAREADRFLFTRESFTEFPDLRVSGPDFAASTRITDANPQQDEFLWGRRILFDFENRDGVRLQGILAVPDDYQPGEKRPMLVTFYEKSSQGMHRYPDPSYLGGMGSSPIQAVSEGYLTMLPDIHFRTRTSHSDMLECVEAAVVKVIEMGYADPEHIGVTGHSYGGQGVAFIGVRSTMFAAVGMGAGVTDLTYDFNQNWGWAYGIDGGSGSNAPNYYLYGQGRQATDPWTDPELYRFESALTHVPEARAPFLIMHGTSDPTVAFQHALGLYNAMRFNGKDAILLAYPGEGHGLRRLANRKDLTVRYFQFFNHYLKGEPAPPWMTEGVPYLEKNRE